jgi:hypothetical protein
VNQRKQQPIHLAIIVVKRHVANQRISAGGFQKAGCFIKIECPVEIPQVLFSKRC